MEKVLKTIRLTPTWINCFHRIKYIYSDSEENNAQFHNIGLEMAENFKNYFDILPMFAS